MAFECRRSAPIGAQERLARDMPKCIVRWPNQVPHLASPHADLQRGELAIRGRCSDELSVERPVPRLHYRTPGEEGEEESDVSLDEGVLVAICWWDAQPNNTATKVPVGRSIFVCISFSIPDRP